MKNGIMGFVLVLAIAFAGSALAADTAGENGVNPATTVNGNPVEQFTGKYWVNSTEGNKEAYLFGIESAIAVEYFINARLNADAAKSGKKSFYTLSPFEKGWMQAFKNTTRKEMMDEINTWYTQHPEKIDTPVMRVIWYELIKPRLEAQSK